VQDAIAARDESPRANERSADWCGYLIADVLGLDLGNGLSKAERSSAQRTARVKVRVVLHEWLSRGDLKVASIRSSRDARYVKIVVVGAPVIASELAGVK
jgi:hypothetical protein